ncbi:hypothetical protein KC669_01770 [Candidatus Dojkabacteria bacterium]|uniref:Uncharacterized protein n=1 Tax=Candidatus Dojkabacteria bacterium TaxID=2099670 RepID=A0A955RLI8_9BACT|nr:hypothetical protein [Candidatus Dojkabacteria bacterium]
MKYLFVKDYEFEDYKITSNRKNRIHIFWIGIIRSMPNGIKKEVKTKFTNLTLKGVEGKYNITGAKPYQFITESGSDDLSKYLSNFAVFVESDTPEIYKWKEDVHNILITKFKEI